MPSLNTVYFCRVVHIYILYSVHLYGHFSYIISTLNHYDYHQKKTFLFFSFILLSFYFYIFEMDIVALRPEISRQQIQIMFHGR